MLVGKIWQCLLLTHATRTQIWVQRQGTQQWAATVARAMSYGAKDHAGAMDNFQSFQSKVMDNLAKTVPLPHNPLHCANQCGRLRKLTC